MAGCKTAIAAIAAIAVARRILTSPFPWAFCPTSCALALPTTFFLLTKDTAFMDGRGCRSCTSQGCRLPRPERPVACGLFPFVLNLGELYLYQICPASMFTPLAHMAELGARLRHGWQNSASASRSTLPSICPQTCLQTATSSCTSPCTTPQPGSKRRNVSEKKTGSPYHSGTKLRHP